MNYYEELGVSPSSSTADIRSAYKSLVRLLHPDQQQDENLKRLSELQLRRLNRILEVLTDPIQRRQYDLTLNRFLPVLQREDPASRNVSPSDIRAFPLHMRLDAGLLIWALIGTIALGSAVVWLRSPDTALSRGANKAAERTNPAATTAEQTAEPLKPVKEISPKPEQRVGIPAQGRAPAGSPFDPRTAEPEHPGDVTPKDPAPSQAPAVHPPAVNTVVLASPEATKKPEVVAPAPLSVEASKNPAEPATLPPPKAASASISGRWLYVPQLDTGKQTMYPVEYIELRINNRGGTLKGQYHGKYRVADRAISSEINFQFEGKQGDTVSLVPWSASNGARGELRLKRLTDESIEVNWITTTFGSSNTLASGKAVLYRSDTP